MTDGNIRKMAIVYDDSVYLFEEVEEVLRWEGFIEKVGFEPGAKE